MQSPQYAAIGRIHVIVLNEFEPYACRSENIAAIGFGEKTTPVSALNWRNQQETCDIEPLNLHAKGSRRLFPSGLQQLEAGTKRRLERPSSLPEGLR